MRDLAATNGVEEPRRVEQSGTSTGAGHSATAAATPSSDYSKTLQRPVRYTLHWMIDWEVRRT
jgi:hypothetical protein